VNLLHRSRNWLISDKSCIGKRGTSFGQAYAQLGKNARSETELYCSRRRMQQCSEATSIPVVSVCGSNIKYICCPVTLCLDDLQWADSASIAAVNQLLLTGGLASPNAKFFFLGCYRDGETDNRDSLWKTLCNNDLISARSTDVKLDCMDEEILTTMVSETLCLSPRLTQSLSSIIYHKTKGNPLFVS
jgi:hypothetical protein